MNEQAISERATFAAGCFWGVESAFRTIPGVLDVTVGYTGGTSPQPTYREVCSGRTGHAEAIDVLFDPARVSYATLVKAFFEIHDPTTLNRQGPDVGSQYRSAIFYHDAAQRDVANATVAELDSAHRFRRPIVSQVVPAETFHPAEDYHQRYFEKNGIAGHACPV